MCVFGVGFIDRFQDEVRAPLLYSVLFCHTSYFKNQSLHLTLSDSPAGNLEYVQTTPAGHIPFGF